MLNKILTLLGIKSEPYVSRKIEISDGDIAAQNAMLEAAFLAEQTKTKRAPRKKSTAKKAPAKRKTTRKATPRKATAKKKA